MKVQAVFSVVLAFALGGFSPAAQAAVTPTISPLAPIKRSAQSNAARTIAVKQQTARVARAAICTEDISQIKFQEYYVDWSLWMDEVGSRWSAVFNSAYNRGKFHADGLAFVQFTCKADGSITEVSLEKSSGDPMCDRSQIEALVNCMPLPAFPVGSAKKSVTMMYVWEYGQNGHFVKAKAAAAKPAQKRIVPQSERVSITGKLM
jgi:TonB family protein